MRILFWLGPMAMYAAEIHARDVQRLQEMRALGRAGVEHERMRNQHVEQVAMQRERALEHTASSAVMPSD